MEQRLRTRPDIPVQPPRPKTIAYQHGGAPQQHTPIVAASGEFIIHPDAVLRIGKGDLKRGHDVLDIVMKDLRKKHAAKLKALPPPVKR